MAIRVPKEFNLSTDTQIQAKKIANGKYILEIDNTNEPEDWSEKVKRISELCAKEGSVWDDFEFIGHEPEERDLDW